MKYPVTAILTKWCLPFELRIIADAEFYKDVSSLGLLSKYSDRFKDWMTRLELLPLTKPIMEGGRTITRITGIRGCFGYWIAYVTY